jgi:hypothetical protein
MQRRYDLRALSDGCSDAAPGLSWRLSEDPTDYLVGICIETSAMTEQNTLWLPRVDFSDCRLRLPPLEQ